MGNKEKVLVYPYNTEFTPVVRHRKLIDKYEISQLISPNGWGLCGKDAGYADGGLDVGIIVNDGFENSLSDCDSVLFTDSSTLLDIDRYIFPKIESALKAKKNIIIAAKFKEDILAKIACLCEKEGGRFKHFSPRLQFEFPRIPNEEIQEIFKIEVPVIFVLGVAERTHKFEIQLSLRERIIDMGYKVSQIGTRAYCELLDFHSFPEFMFDNSISEVVKIILFNQFVKKIEIDEKPDLIIVGIPGGIMPFDDTFNNRFGVLAYEVSNAITPDAAILSLFYDDYKIEDLVKLSTSIRYKLGTEVSCYNIANISFDYKSSQEERRMIYTTIDSKLVDRKKEYINSSNIKAYNVLEENGCHEIANELIDKLTEYGSVECL
ncbi:MAG: TIGR04066 family peptide maturation system protein [Bacillota bacterium]